MVNYGMIPSVIDGSEDIFKEPQNIGLPKQFSYKKYLPTVLNQGNKSICVPCSISAYINWDINLKDGVENDNDVKVMEIFKNRGHNKDGMTFKEAFSFLRKEGVKTNEGKYKINRYAKINSILALRYALILNGPCFGGLPVYNSSETEFWYKNNDSLNGLHAVCIIGYNDDGFILRNSWGTTYGEDGYSFIKNEDFNCFTELWTIV